MHTHETVRFEIAPRGPFSLAASAAFLCGFTPASGSARGDADGMTFGFTLDGSFEPVVARVTESHGRVICTAQGSSDADAVRRQVARILSLDHDGAGWAQVGERDPVIGALMTRYPGQRPVCFYSPYEAACWGILAARTPMRVAARIRAELSLSLGTARTLDGETVQVFPSPRALLTARELASVPQVKARRLRGIAAAAIEGRLDAALLRSMETERARAHLSELEGVGPWTSSHILLRGAGVIDEPAFFEPRVRAGFRLAYGLEREPTEGELQQASARWRPFRTWASVLLAAHLSRSGQWNASVGMARGRHAARSPKKARPMRSATLLLPFV